MEPKELKRLENLYSYKILDTPEEQTFNELTRLAAIICHAPISLITFVDEKRQWFKAKHGVDIKETDRVISFCQFTILEEGILEINDTLESELVKNNPLVTGPPFIRFYAGAPLISKEGYKLGSICVISDSPQNLSLDQREALEILSRQVMELVINNRK